MTKGKITLTLTLLAGAFNAYASGTADVIRANNIGYLPSDIKAAVYLGETPVEDLSFSLFSTGSSPTKADSVAKATPWDPIPHAARVYFTSVTQPGEYLLAATDRKGKTVASKKIYIGSDAYSRLNIHELPLEYIRQQRCGYNPAWQDSCHKLDGIAVLAGENTGKHFDVTGGWHDASDYLQYLTTSANSIYQMMFAYQANPGIWGDRKDARGLEGSNGVPDILDEVKYGLEWMLKMNPNDSLYFNQIADDRDHRYVGSPAEDNVDYGWGAGGARPVYPTYGKPYGLEKYKNRSRGEASSVGKYASVFALASSIFSDSDPEFSALLAQKAKAAYEYAKARPGACQTACCVSPYFYEEDNWVDDMELAAAEMHNLTGEKSYLNDAVNYGRMEPVTPWMGADSARHYQWYPFINLGHYLLAKDKNQRIAKEFRRNMRTGIERVSFNGKENAFLCGLPFIWCSNNLATAFVTQAMLYRQLTGDETFRESETAMRDWILGTNPWGQTMIILPENIGIDSPLDPHSALSNLDIKGQKGRNFLIGGIVDGPVYTSIYNSLWGVHLRNDDRFASFQGPSTVYHDDYSDYSTNEPTLDGTASTTWFLGTLSNQN